MKKFLFTLIFILFSPILTNASSNSLEISSNGDSFYTGEKVIISVYAVSTDQSINAISGTLIYPTNLEFLSIDQNGTIVDFWTKNPAYNSNKINFEGVILNPGYKGNKGIIFNAIFVARNEGDAKFFISEGSILANDGFGTNIINSLGKKLISIKLGEGSEYIEYDSKSSRLVALPVITEYSQSILSSEGTQLKGLGEPYATTKIVFKDVSFKSIGERFMDFIQTKKKKLDDVLVKNDKNGSFEYVSGKGLVAGVYNATPFLVDENTNTERPGLGVQFLINDNKIIKNLVVFINILALIIPIVGLVVIIYCHDLQNYFQTLLN